MFEKNIMAANLEGFEGSDLNLKLMARLATSNFEFRTPLHQDEKSTSASTEREEEEAKSPRNADLDTGQDQSAYDAFPQEPINFGAAPQARGISAFPAIAAAPKNRGGANGAPNLEPLNSVARPANASPIYKVSKVKKTGNIQIDSLLNTHKLRGAKITYSFFDGGNYDGKKGETHVRAITGKMKSYLRNILENVIEPLINVNFVEVSDKGKNFGQIRYMFSDGPSYAYAYSPENGNWQEGDVHFDPKDIKDWHKGAGSDSYETLIRETLHALGLKHLGKNNGSGQGDPPFLPNRLDTNANTVMTNNDDSKHAVTLMPYDIRALQYLYGAKKQAAGDTTYKFDTVYGYTVGGDFFGGKAQAIKQTLWDSAGKDTFDFSGLALKKSGYRFDLSEGGWITTQAAYESSAFKAKGNGKTYKTTALGTRIAYNMTIENVVASSSNDIIIANKAANSFRGYGAGKKTGNDVIFGSDQLDTLDLSAYKALDVTQSTRGDDLVLNLGDNGSITLKAYFAAGKNNRINILFDGTTTSSIILGTASDNQLEGTDSDDYIKTLAGNDTLIGKAGSDILWGGGDDDTLIGGGGNDTLMGGTGQDVIDGGGGNDTIISGDGSDLVTGGRGADTYVYEHINRRNAGDTITDFEPGKDKFDLTTFFSDAKYGSTNPFRDYIQIVGSGKDTQVKVDWFGDTGDKFKTLVTLTGIDPKKLNASHFLV